MLEEVAAHSPTPSGVTLKCIATLKGQLEYLKTVRIRQQAILPAFIGNADEATTRRLALSAAAHISVWPLLPRRQESSGADKAVFYGFEIRGANGKALHTLWTRFSVAAERHEALMSSAQGQAFHPPLKFPVRTIFLWAVLSINIAMGCTE